MSPDKPSKMRRTSGVLTYCPAFSEILTELMQGILIAAVVMIPIKLIPQANLVVLSAWLGAGWLLFWLISLSARKIWQFLLASAVLVMSPVMLPSWLGFQIGILECVFLVGIMVFLGIRAFIQKLNQSKEKKMPSLTVHFLALALFLGLDLLADYLGYQGLVQAYFYMAVIYLLLAVVRWHWQSLGDQLSKYARLATQPAGRVIRFNRALLAVFAGFLLLLLLISPWLRLHELVPKLLSLILLGLRWVVRLILSLFSDQPSEPEPQETGGPVPSGSPQLPEPGETAVWMKVLSEIFYYLFLGLTCLILLGLIILGLVWIYRRFYAARQSGSDTLESLLPNIKDQIKERVNRSSRRIRQRFSLDPDQRIRRLYARIVEKMTRSSADGGRIGLFVLTPRQIALLVGQQNPELVLEMTCLYEKARYGNKLCTGEDVHKMQRLCREVKGGLH